MNRRTLIILIVVLLVLIGLRWMQNRSHENSLAEPDRVALLPGFSMDSLDRIELRGPAGGELVLTRETGLWKVASRFGHPAKQSKIDELATELAGLTGQFRSDREDVLSGYSLDDSTAVSMRLFGTTGEEVEHLLLGASLARGGGLFLCKAGESKVYASQSRLLGVFGLWGDTREPDARSFLDMKLWSWDPGEVEAFSLVTAEGRMDFAKAPADTLTGEASWILDGAPARGSAVEQVVTTLANLQGRDLLDPAEDLGLGEASRRVELRLAGGETKVIRFGENPEGGGDVPFKVDGSLYAYTLFSSYPDRIFKKREDF